MLADGDGVADIRFAADRDQGVVVEVTVGPHRELPLSPTVSHRKWAALSRVSHMVVSLLKCGDRFGVGDVIGAVESAMMTCERSGVGNRSV